MVVMGDGNVSLAVEKRNRKRNVNTNPNLVTLFMLVQIPTTDDL